MKKVLALIISICLILSAVPMLLASAIETSDWAKSGTVTVTGNEIDGFKLVGEAAATAAITQTTDFSKQDVKIKLNTAADNTWDYMAITKSAVTGNILPAAGSLDGLYVLFVKQYGNLVIQLWDGANAVTILPSLATFDFSVEHTIGFEKVSDKWYMSFDGVTYTTDKGGLDLTSYLSALVGVSNQYTFSGSTAYTIDKVRFTNPDWTSYGDGINITSNATDGYKISGPQYTLANYLSDKDFTKKDVSFKFNLDAIGQWAYMAVTKNGINNAANLMPTTANMEGAYFLIQKNSDSEAVVLAWVGDPAGGATGYGTTPIATFNPAGEHTIGFEKVSDKWYLQLDGKIYNEYNGGLDLTGYLSGLVGVNCYYTFTASTNYSFEGLKLADHVKGTTGQYDWNSTGAATVTGNDTDGYKLTGAGAEVSSKCFDFDFSKKDVSFKLDISAVNNWAYMAITKTGPVNPGLLLPDAVNKLDGIYLLFEKTSATEGRVSMWVGDAEGGSTGYGLTVLGAIDPSAAHTVGFEKVDGKWYLVLDGKINKDTDLSSYLNSLVGVNNYYNFTGSVNYTFESLKFVNHTSPKDEETAPVKEGWVTVGDGASTTGNDKDGYTLKGPAATTSSIYADGDFSKNDVSFKFNVNKKNQWAYIAVTKTAPANSGNLLPEGKEMDGVYLLIEKRSDKEAIVLVWVGDPAGGGTGYGTTVLANTDPSIEQRVGFVKENGKWYLRLNGVIYNEENGGIDLTAYLKNLAGVRNYYTFSGSTDYTFEGLKFVDSSVQPDLPPFINVGFEVGGNSKTGYSLKGELGSVAVFRNPMDVTTDKVQMKMKIKNTGEWVLLGFATSQSNHGMLFDSEEDAKKINALDIIITNMNDGSVQLARWNAAEQVTQVIGVIKEFDWDKVHTFEFVNTLDSWYLQVDGEALYGLDMTQWVAPLVKNKTYVKILAGSEMVEITNFKVLNPNSPRTGDTNNQNLYALGVLLAALLTGAVVIALKKQKKVNTK